MSSHIFTTLAMEDVYKISVVQQCRMLESSLAIQTLAINALEILMMLFLSLTLERNCLILE